MVLEIWGGPWVSPGRSDCCYFVGFRWFSGMCGFLLFFHRYVEAMSFSESEKLLVGMLILGYLNVSISLVLALFLESHLFRRCALERSWSVLGELLGWLWRSGGLLG